MSEKFENINGHKKKEKKRQTMIYITLQSSALNGYADPASPMTHLFLLLLQIWWLVRKDENISNVTLIFCRGS